VGWQDLLRNKDVAVVILPWVGGRQAQWGQRIWTIDGTLPREHGWYEFQNNGSRLLLNRKVDPQPETLLVSGMAGALGTKRRAVEKGYLVGDRLVPDTVQADEDSVQLASGWNTVYLLDEGLDRFARIQAGKAFENGPLIFMQQDMPAGPEAEVTQAYEDKKPNLNHIKGVSPALDAAFRFEVWRRDEAEKYRKEQARLRREAEERRAKEERRAELAAKIGTAEGRRAMAQTDFGEAAKAALAVGGAEYLDHRSLGRGEFAVKYLCQGRRLECVCDIRMHITDAGICLNAHRGDRDFQVGTKGDAFFTLESLPSVVKEAINGNKLVVFRHVAGDMDDRDDDRWDDDD